MYPVYEALIDCADITCWVSSTNYDSQCFCVVNYFFWLYCRNIVPFLKRFGLNPVTGEVYLLSLLLTELASVIILWMINVSYVFSKL